MKVIIQCAATKAPDAGYLKDAHGRRVLFVADPAGAPPQPDCIHARPDDRSDQDASWRESLRRYNRTPEHNLLGLKQACQLYANSAYGDLTRALGKDRVLILSAGWGLLPSTFLTPAYDITFSSNADPWKRRRPRDVYNDFRMAEEDDAESLVFLGGKDYLPLFAELTSQYRGRRIAVYNSKVTPTVSGIEFIRYPTTTRTNWHYEGARALLEGSLSVPV